MGTDAPAFHKGLSGGTSDSLPLGTRLALSALDRRYVTMEPEY
jgi:hypothetical protein